MLVEEELKKIIVRYGFTQKELYRLNDDLILVSARGIRKIISNRGLEVTKRVKFDPTGGVVVIARVNGNGGSPYEATGEAKLGLNTTFKYPVAVAEARANGRAVLMWAGLYEKGIIAEAELEMEVESEQIIAKRKEQITKATESLLDKIKKP